MLDLQLIRERPDYVKAQIARLHAEASIDDILEQDRRRRELLTDLEGLRAQMNAASKEVGRTRDSAQRQALMDQVRGWKERVPALEEEVRQVEGRLNALLLEVPNLPHERTPDGRDESENVLVRAVGEPRALDFAPQAHWDLGPALDILDLERGVKLSGSRFLS